MSSISKNLKSPPNGYSNTLSGSINSSALTINMNSSVDTLPTEGVGVVFKKDADNNPISTSVEFIHWTGRSGTQLTLTDTGDRGIAGSYGSAAQSHDAGDYFEVWVSNQYYESLRTGFTTEHSSAGVHDSTKVAVISGGYATTLTTTASTNVTLPTTGTLATLAGTETLTNKRVTKRITSITSSATPTVNTDNCDCVTITALATDITSMTTNLSGTPTNFQTLLFRIKDDGTARAITWGASFEAKGGALPTTTVISKVLTVGFVYDTVTSKWGCVFSSQEA